MRMKSFFSKFSGTSRRMLFGLSPWLIVGVFSVLALAIMVMAVRNTDRERTYLVHNYMDRADALIWALEAGTRAGRAFEKDLGLLQPLVTETARQPGILYMAIVDVNGRILAHSDKSLVGSAIPPGSLPGGVPASKAAWRSSERDGRKVFEVYREFSPVLAAMKTAMYWSALHGIAITGGSPVVQQQATNTFAFVGFDQNPFEEALNNNFWLNVLTAAIIASIGLAGVISLFWAHNFRRSRRLLKDTQALASEVVTNLPVGLITSDPKGNIGMCNDAALKLLQTDRQAAANAPLRTVPGLDWDGITANIRKRGTILEREMELLIGETRSPVSVSASQIRNDEGIFLGHVFILRDIAEVRRLQREVRRNERLTALGNLAAGVAHEVRNPLSSIKGLATYIAQKVKPGGMEEEVARTMIEEVNRLDRVVSELLEFSRPGAVRLAEQDIHETVRHALRLADADIRSKAIRVILEEDPAFPKVHINTERVTQALLNLFLNAVQAMEPGGEMRIAVALQPGGDTFSVAVADTGKGMPEEVLSSIFLPYFTTKPSGTGLGLAIVHQIMEGHGGTVRVESEPGGGSVFTLEFPLKPASRE